MSTVLRVVLNDAPRDVLIHIVDHGPVNRVAIVSAMEQQGYASGAEVVRGVAGALRLLHELRFIKPTGGGETPLVYSATGEGRDVVMKARAEAQRDV